jgi:hypothetical protein
MEKMHVGQSYYESFMAIPYGNVEEIIMGEDPFDQLMEYVLGCLPNGVRIPTMNNELLEINEIRITRKRKV